jgi:hypothetical protein
VLRSFELLQVKSIWMLQQHVWTPFSVRHAKGFLSKTQIWEDSCHRPDDVYSLLDAILDKARHAYKVQPSGRQYPWSGRASLNKDIVCRRSSTIQTLRQHRLDVALFKKEFRANLESRSHSCLSGCP